MATIVSHAANRVDLVLYFPDGTTVVLERAGPKDLEFAARELRTRPLTIQHQPPDIPPHGESS